jgi:hypothetical protein
LAQPRDDVIVKLIDEALQFPSCFVHLGDLERQACITRPITQFD